MRIYNIMVYSSFCNIFIIYIDLDRMQIPHIGKYQSLIQKHIKPTFQPYEPFTYSPRAIEQLNLEELFSNIQQINHSRSYYSVNINEKDNTMESYQLQSLTSSQNIQFSDVNSQMTRSQTKSRRNTNKSLIFMNQSFGKNKEKNLSNQKHLIIYYFNMPIHKTLPFNNKTTISQMIISALQAYANDKSLDHSKIKNMGYTSIQYSNEDYELRLLKSQDSFQADMKIEPIGYQRLVIQNMFDSLVLMHNTSSISPKKDPRSSFVPETPNSKQSNISIQLYNEQKDLLQKIEMNKSETLQKLYKYIQSKEVYNLKNYYLVQNLNEQDQLPKDYQIDHLSSNKLYIVLKKFIDQSEQQIMNKPKLLKYSSKNKQKDDTIIQNLPIGLAEASQYEEFSVIKINNFKMQQERIIGIDQHKIYNYDRSVKQQGRKTSFFSKIFGAHEITGTKNPFRLISQIVDLKKTQNGLTIIYKEKQNIFVIKNNEIRQRMYRKLNYLLNYYKDQQQRQNKKYKKTQY